jgi:hypothetical protein
MAILASLILNICSAILVISLIEFLFSSMRMRVLGMSLANLAKDIRLINPNDETTKKIAGLIEQVSSEMEERFLNETWMGRRILRKNKKRQAKAIHEAADRILKEAEDGK